MSPRAPRIDPELKAHQDWLGYLQPRGLVVAPAAMQEAGWVLEQGGRELIEQQEQFREALQPLHINPFDAMTAAGKSRFWASASWMSCWWSTSTGI